MWTHFEEGSIILKASNKAKGALYHACPEILTTTQYEAHSALPGLA
jgi:hypothetical protein